jgi:MFS family permease
VVAWLGRGTREPARDALLVDSTEPKYYGRVFGFHRGMDTLGAILGPALAFFLIKFMPLRSIFLVALIPSILAFLTITFFVKEGIKINKNQRKLVGSVKLLPFKFRLFLIAVGIFGLGNFADSLFILRATQLLTPIKGAILASSLAILLYTLHNIFYAGFSFPIGALADKLGRKRLLSFGYFLTGIVSLGFIFNIKSPIFLGLFFILAGIAIAITDALERTVAADLLPENLRGTGYGTLATVNGIGDFASSAIVGYLWSAISPLFGFGYGALMTILGGFLLFSFRI